MPIELASEDEHDPRYMQPLTRCAASRDGECDHPHCPQKVDHKPSCPLWYDEDDEY